MRTLIVSALTTLFLVTASAAQSITFEPYRFGSIGCFEKAADSLDGPLILIGMSADGFPEAVRMTMSATSRRMDALTLPVDSTALTIKAAGSTIVVTTPAGASLEVIDRSTRSVLWKHVLDSSNENTVTLAPLASGSYLLFAWNTDRASAWVLTIP